MLHSLRIPPLAGEEEPRPDHTDLLYQVSGGVATITLNRPDRMNAISGPMLASFSRALRESPQHTNSL